MKKSITIILALVTILSLTACGDSLEGAEIIEVNTAQDSPAYVEGEDCQQQWNTWGTIVGKMSTQGEGGYYFYDEDGTRKLCYHDFVSDVTVPLCDQPNCDHTGNECNASLDFGTRFLHYYDGNLYTISINSSMDVVVQRISADGRTRGTVGTIFRTANGGSIFAIFHRGYVYCVPEADGLVEHSTQIYRLNLGGSEEAELIHTFEPCIGGDVYMRAYGNYIYIQHQSYADSDANGYTADLYRYNIHTGEMEPVMEGMRRMFAVDDQYLYYDSDTQVIARDLETGEDTVLLDVGYPVYLMMDENYLYCDDLCGRDITHSATGSYPEGTRTITIIDKNTFGIVGTVEWETNFHYELVGASGGILLGAKSYDPNDPGFFRYDLSQLLSTGEAVWEELN